MCLWYGIPLALTESKRERDAVMKNMPSVMNEMPIAAAPPAAGKWMQHERLLPVADGGSDFSASATNANSPETFHRLLQKNLHGQDRGSASEPSAGSDRQ